MAIATFADLLAKLQAPSLKLVFVRATNATALLGPWYSGWTVGTVPALGTNPTTAATCSSATTGSFISPTSTLPNYMPPGKDYYLGSIDMVNPGTLRGHSVLVLDRLSHRGGLDATSVAVQTTNLPTAALPRWTSGVGVQACLEIYTALGTTATTVTCSYTNEAGTPGQTSQVQVIGGVGANELGRMITITLQTGDKGIRSVESVTLAGSTVSAAGNFGVTLFKPLAMASFFSPTNITPGGQTWFPIGNGLAQIDPNACLQLAYWTTTTSTNAFFGTLNFIEND